MCFFPPHSELVACHVKKITVNELKCIQALKWDYATFAKTAATNGKKLNSLALDVKLKSRKRNWIKEEKVFHTVQGAQCFQVSTCTVLELCTPASALQKSSGFSPDGSVKYRHRGGFGFNQICCTTFSINEAPDLVFQMPGHSKLPYCESISASALQLASWPQLSWHLVREEMKQTLLLFTIVIHSWVSRTWILPVV